MSTYLRDANHHAEKIGYYYANAGVAGYSQARHHQNQLDEILGRASRSKNGRSDVPVIQSIIEKTRPKMEKMKERENQADTQEE